MTTPGVQARHNRLAGIGYICAGVLLFVIGDALSKSLVTRYSVPQIAFVKSLAACVVLLPWLLRAEARAGLRTRRPMMHMLRNLMGVAELACFYIALRTVPLADATAIYYAAPLIATALSVVMLREHVSWPRWAAIVLGFAGMLLIVQPGGTDLNVGLILATMGAALYAGLMIFNRYLGETETTMAMVVYAVVGELAVMGVIAPFYWTPMSLMDALNMAVMGIAVMGGIFAFVRAYMLAPVASVAPFDYTALIWAALFGFVFWNEVPDATVLAGAGLIMVCGLYLLHRERIEGVLERDKGRPYDHHE